MGKFAASVLTLLFVIVFNFFLFRVMGDPTAQFVRIPGVTQQEVKKLKEHYGLDKPLLGQFTDYMDDTAHLDFGTSQASGQPVVKAIGEALPWTLLLVGVGTLIATLLGSWMGVRAATRRGKRTDSTLLGFNMLTYAAPEYWIGILLILIFGVWIPIFPTGLQMTPGADFSGFIPKALDVANHLVLPVTAMTLMLLGQYFLIMRASMVDVLTEDFITVKRATGMRWDRVVSRHAVPNALLPLVTLSAIQFGFVVAGSITIETVFSWPGLGQLTFTAINDKDFPILQGAFLVFSVGVIAANLLADILYFFLDPRVQTS